MKRSFLEELGLEKDVIDKIMSENGSDIENAKATVTKKFDSDNAVLSFHIYMWNAWNKEECALVFNGNTDTDDWIYTIGHHIWNKWIDYCDQVGPTAAVAFMVRTIPNFRLGT